MIFSKFLRLSVSVVMTLVAAAPFACATPFTNIIVLGDSLSDNGSLHPTSPPPPYFGGRYSNGPVAVEQLAAHFGSNLIDLALAGATTGIGNYGDGGSTTVDNGLPGMAEQLAYLQGAVPSQLFPNSLFVVWGGPNDLLTGGSAYDAAKNIAGFVNALKAEGAQHILVPGMPNLGLTPDFSSNPALAAGGTLYAQAFNAFLQQDLPTGATYFDTFGLVQSIVSNPGGYGLTDVKDPCVNVLLGTVCSNPNQYLFWDGFHPTTAADNIIMNQFATATTPEPSSWLLLSTGLTGCAALLRRKLYCK